MLEHAFCVVKILSQIKKNVLIHALKSKVMMYEGYHFWGMHLIWWFIWMMFLVTIFATPYNIPGQRMRKDSPLDILQKRLASGEITNEEYQEKKTLLESGLAK